MRRSRIALVLVATWLIGGCDGGVEIGPYSIGNLDPLWFCKPGQGDSREEFPTDTSRIVDTEDVDAYWKLECENNRIIYPGGKKVGEFFGCTRIRVVIGSAGRVELADLLNAYPDDPEFIRSSVTAVGTKVFAPAPGNSQRIPIRVVFLNTFSPRPELRHLVPSADQRAVLCGA